MTELRPIRRALISVYDKAGLEELVPALVKAGVQIVSTGSTARIIEGLGAEVTPVERLTGFPETLDGRVKTLHPKVHAGLLADLRLPEHARQLEELGIEPFDWLDCVDAGDAPVTPANLERGHEVIRRKVLEVASSGAIPVVLGGDHSITFPSASAVSAKIT